MTTTVALAPADARQWLRLRQLRVQRARAALALALTAVHEAQQVIAARQARIDEARVRLADLTTTWSGAGCVDMPRWGAQLGAHRAALSERLERDDYALLDEQETLRECQAMVAQRRAELARAQAREDAVDATLRTQRRERAHTQEQQAELDAEDAWRATQ